MKRLILAHFILVCFFGCKNANRIHNMKTIEVHHIPPTNQYFLQVSRVTIRSMTDVSVIKHNDKSLHRNLTKLLVKNIQSKVLEEVSSIDGRVLICWASKDSSYEVLMDKYGHFESGQKIYDVDSNVLKLLIKSFPEERFFISTL